MTDADDVPRAGAHGQPNGRSPLATWTRLLLLTAVAAYVLAAVGLAKADKGGKGMQVTMIVVASVVLLVALLVRRRAAAAEQGIARQAKGQHERWLDLIRIAAAAGAVLAAFGAVKSKDHQVLSAVMLVIDLWVLSIAVRFDRVAHHAKVEGTA